MKGKAIPLQFRTVPEGSRKLRLPDFETLGKVVRLSALRSGVPTNFVRGGVQQIQVRIQDRENGDLGAVAP